jgi:hypothetical protein
MIGYRCGYPEELIAWKALDFEYEELGNWTTLADLMKFLGRPTRDIDKYRPAAWKLALTEFRNRYGDAEGVWICDEKKVARSLYGVHPLGSKKSDGSQMYEVEYDPKLVLIDLGEDGKFVLKPKSMEPTTGNPLRRNPARTVLAKAEEDVLKTLHKVKCVRSIYGVGSYYNSSKTYPGDIDFVVKLSVPFGTEPWMEKFNQAITALKSRHEDAKGVSIINIFLEDIFGRALNSVELAFRYNHGSKDSWDEMITASYAKHGGGAGEYQHTWKRKAL